MGHLISLSFPRKNLPPITPFFLLLSTSVLEPFFPQLFLTACPENNKIWISDVPTHDQGSVANRNCSWPNRQGSGTSSLCILPSQTTAITSREYVGEKASLAESRGLLRLSSPREQGQLSGCEATDLPPRSAQNCVRRLSKRKPGKCNYQMLHVALYTPFRFSFLFSFLLFFLFRCPQLILNSAPFCASVANSALLDLPEFPGPISFSNPSGRVVTKNRHPEAPPFWRIHSVP